MMSTGDDANNKNLQVSIKHPSLPELIIQKSCERNGRDKLSEEALNFFSKPVQLSDFLKELEEAENEPFPDIKHPREDDNDDETDTKEEEILKLNEVEISETEVDRKELEAAENEPLPDIKYPHEDIYETDTKEHAILDLDEGILDTKADVKDEHVPFIEQSAIIDKKSIVDIAKRSFITPAKQSCFNNFLTPNMMKPDKTRFKDVYTQIQTRSGVKIQCKINDNVNVQTPLNTVAFLNRDSAKKSLHLPQRLQIERSRDVIYEDAQEYHSMEDMNNILYKTNIQTPSNTISFVNRDSTRKKSLFSCPKFNIDKDIIPEDIKFFENTPSNTSLMNRKSIKEKALFFPQTAKDKAAICDAPEQYENKENIETNQNFEENMHKVLYSIPVENAVLDAFEKIVVNKIEYVVLNQIGRGGSSVVYHCYNPLEKCERAIKKVSLTGEKTCIDGYINEVKMLHKLQQCDRIIKMYAYEIVDRKVLYMVLERGEKDLSKILKELSTNTDHLPIYMLIYYWMEMLYAVKQIHKNGIIHSDLKPANFLMVSSKLKLIDFGISSSLQNDMTSVVKNVQIGSFNYISPEALNNDSLDNETAKFKISYKSDVWSLGCILYQLAYRKTPFQHIRHTYAKLSAIIDPQHVIEYPQVNHLPLNIIRTLKACLTYDMKKRPAIDDLIKEFENMYY